MKTAPDMYCGVEEEYVVLVYMGNEFDCIRPWESPHG